MRTVHARMLRLAHKDGTYERLFAVQDGCCGICRKTPQGIAALTGRPLRRLDIDHDHRTLAIRGLLCRGCNMRLRKGLDADWLEGAANYLRSAHPLKEAA